MSDDIAPLVLFDMDSTPRGSTRDLHASMNVLPAL